MKKKLFSVEQIIGNQDEPNHKKTTKGQARLESFLEALMNTLSGRYLLTNMKTDFRIKYFNKDILLFLIFKLYFNKPHN